MNDVAIMSELQRESDRLHQLRRFPATQGFIANSLRERAAFHQFEDQIRMPFELAGVEESVNKIAKNAEDPEVQKEAKALAAEIAKYKKDIQ